MSGNPILTLLDLNGSLQGQDRNGIFTATGSGALRWQPAEGARVNYARNPGLLSNATDWAAAGTGSLTRTADTQFESDWCAEVAADLTTEGANITVPVRGVASSNVTLTIGVNTDLVSGASDWDVRAQAIDAAGSPIGSAGTAVDFTPSGAFGRSVLTLTTPTTANAEGVQVQFRRKSAVTSTLRLGDVTVEIGSTAGTWFAPVWLFPITGQLGTPHASPSVSRAAAWVEGDTTNLVPNPWRAVDNTGWSALNGSTARTTSYAYQGPAAGLVTASAANVEERISITAAAASHTAQAIVRNLAAASRQCQLTYNGSLIGSPVSVAAGASATITAAFTGTGSAANLGVRWIDSANTETFVTYYLGAEAKVYATSPCPAIDSSGAVITGYSWAGTAHGSVSTRGGTTVTVSSSGRVDSIQGCAAMRVKRLVDSVPYERGFAVGAPSNNDWLSVVTRAFPPNFAMQASVDGSSETVVVAGSVVGTWCNVIGDWSLAEIGISINAGARNTNSRSNAPRGVLSDPTIRVAGRSAAYQALNGYIGPFAIYDAPLSDTRRSMVNTAIDNGDDLWSLFAGNPYTFFQLRPY